MLKAFYIFVAVAACFVILSLAVVRAHERKLAKKEESAPAEADGLPQKQEDEFFTSPLFDYIEPEIR